MGKCNNCNKHQNGKGNQNNQKIEKRIPEKALVPIRAEIHIPNEDDFIKISKDEYTELIAIATTFDIIERWVKSHPSYVKIDPAELLLLFGEIEEDDKE